MSAQAPTASGIARPIRPLIQTTVILGAFLCLSVSSVLVLKEITDRRLDSSVVSETVGDVHGCLEKNNADAADRLLCEVLEVRPQLAPSLAWEFIDEISVMPKFRSALRDVLNQLPDDNGIDTLQAEILFRSGESDRVLVRSESTRIQSSLYRAAEAINAQKFKHLPKVAFDSGASLTAIGPPPSSVIWSNPVPRPSSISNGTDQPPANEPATQNGLLNLLRGNLDRAKASFMAAWNGTRGGRNADTAYWLGVIQEACGDNIGAGEWYRKAMELCDTHRAAAQAYLRVTSPGTGASKS